MKKGYAPREGSDQCRASNDFLGVGKRGTKALSVKRGKGNYKRPTWRSSYRTTPEESFRNGEARYK